jgi:peroxiredoxin
MTSPVYRDLMTPRLAPGDPAYMFELPRDTGETVRLADFTGRLPVALVFGSYT